MVKPFPSVLIQGGVGEIRITSCPIADLMGNSRRQTREAGVKSLETRHIPCKHPFHKLLSGNGKRVFLVLGMGNKVFLAGEHLAHRAHQTGNMLDAVDDHA